MSKRVTSLAVAASLGLGGATAGVVLAPAVSAAASGGGSASTAVAERVAGIREALAGLVGDGSLTAEQADEVATTLAERFPGRGPHGHGGRLHLDAAAEVLGVTVEELRTSLRGGASLADVAAERGVERQAVVDALVADATERLDERVAEGDLTQEQADARKAELVERVTAAVDREGLPRRGGHRHGPGPGPDGEADTPTPQAS